MLVLYLRVVVMKGPSLIRPCLWLLMSFAVQEFTRLQPFRVKLRMVYEYLLFRRPSPGRHPFNCVSTPNLDLIGHSTICDVLCRCDLASQQIDDARSYVQFRRHSMLVKRVCYLFTH